MDKELIKKWYWNDDVGGKRKPILWEILKEIRSHSTDMINIEGNINPLRFQTIGNFNYLINKFIPSLFIQRFENEQKIDVEHPNWHFFRTIQHIRLTEGNKKADVQENFDKLTYGWDLILDFDNISFKKYINGLKKQINNSNSFSKIIEDNFSDVMNEMLDGLEQPYNETKVIKDMLDRYNVPYILNFTGSGFRIAIYWNILKNFFTKEEYGFTNIKLGKFIINEGFKNKQPETIDTTTLGFGMGLTRTMFSIHPITYLVCFPLNDKEFGNFNINLVKSSEIIKTINPISSPLPLNKQREGTLKALYDNFMVEHRNTLTDYKTAIEIEKIKYIKQKERILEMFKELPKEYRDEILYQIQ